MATAAELMEQMGTARNALKDAIAGAAERWEAVIEGEEWTARHAAEHVIGAERSFAGMMAPGVGQEAPSSVELSLASAADAAAAFETNEADCGAIIEAVSDANLSAEAPMPDEAPFPKSVEGVMQLSIYHYNDHAAQISKT